jgi:PAS domain S-box-containing protein
MSKLRYSPFDFSSDLTPGQKLKASDLDFYALLRRQGEAGKLFFNHQRAVLFDVDAIGNLRQQLVETLGKEIAAGILMRFGYSQGYKDADVLNQSYEWATDQDWLMAGPMLHMLEGMVKVEARHIKIDRESGSFLMRGAWHNSYEAEEHLKRFGHTDRPVCWTLSGYASGYASRFFGQELLAIETACIGMGHDHCKWEIKPVAEWGEAAKDDLNRLQPDTDIAIDRLPMGEAFIDAGPLVFCRWRADMGWPVEYVSNNVRQFGLDPADLMADDFLYLSIIHPEDRDAMQQVVSHNAEHHIDQFSHDYRIINKEDQVLWASTQVSAQRDAAGQVTHYIAVTLDITQRKQTEAELNRLSLAVEQSANTVVITDIKGHIEYANPKFVQTTGYSLDEAIGQHTRILKSGATSIGEYKNLWETISAGKVWQGEFHNKKKSGELYWESASISPIKNEQGQITHFLAIKEEITARKVAQMALTRRLVELETVSQVGSAASNILNLDELLDQVVNITCNGFGLYHANIYLLEEPDDTLVLAAASGSATQKLLEARGRIPYLDESSPVARAAREQRGLVIDDVFADANFVPNPVLPDVRSKMAVPIVSGDTLYGVLSVQSAEAGHFTQEDLNVYHTLTNQVAVAIKNARLYENMSRAQQEAEARLHETQILQQLTQSLSATLHTHEVIDAFMKSCTQLLGFDYVIFSLVDEIEQRVKAIAGINVSQDHLDRANHPLDSDDIMADIVRTGKTDVISGWDPRFDATNFEAENMSDWGTRVFAPVTLREESIGLVEVGFKQQVEASGYRGQLKLLPSLINQAALALENARRYEATEQAAHREQVLRQVSAKIRDSVDVNSVMRTAAQEVGRIMGRKSFVYLGQQSNGQDKDD